MCDVYKLAEQKHNFKNVFQRLASKQTVQPLKPEEGGAAAPAKDFLEWKNAISCCIPTLNHSGRVGIWF